MSLAALVRALRAEAHRTNERRLLVLHGEREACYERAQEVLAASEVSDRETILVGERDVLPVERVAPKRTEKLLGTTTEMVVFDAHDACRPNALGRVVGTVDGGGLLVLLTPPLEGWPDRCDGFDASLAVSPYGAEDVSGTFRRRLIELLRAHPGVAIVGAETQAIERSGLTHPAPRLSSRSETSPSKAPERTSDPEEEPFPKSVYDRCLTNDQARCVGAFERLQGRGSALESNVAIVAQADRGRGKSSAAGLAAGALATRGRTVLVTAPNYRASAEIFARAGELLADLDCPVTADDEASPRELVVEDPDADGGSIRFVPPARAADLVRSDSVAVPVGDERDRDDGGPDAVFVDEAAGLPVSVLDSLLAADRVAFTTTVHGYEGAGRGFAIRFRERLEASDHDLVEVRLDDPIRYAAGDPIEVWLFRALLLDARPPVDSLVADATPETVTYERLSTADLVGDERFLRAVFGLLVAAHYRTEPNDLARVLDAPNLSVRALTYRDHVVSVCLLAREGGLAPERRRESYEGARIKGHMLPDVLTSQLRDERAGIPRGLRIVRIATHEAVRSRGLGSYLLDQVRGELDRERRERAGQTERTGKDVGCTRGSEDSESRAVDGRDGERLEPVDWLGVGYGATSSLIRFWRQSGFSTVHVSTTRNERSGEHSVLMLSPLSDRGRELTDRHSRWFARRFPAVLSDVLSDLDPDVARGALLSADAPTDPDLSTRDWRVVCGAAYGPGLYDTNPDPFRRLALAYFTDRKLAGSTFSAPGRSDRVLSGRAERLLVCRVFQARSSEEIARQLGYESERQCLRALGDAYAALADRYGSEVARAERKRYDR